MLITEDLQQTAYQSVKSKIGRLVDNVIPTQVPFSGSMGPSSQILGISVLLRTHM